MAIVNTTDALVLRTYNLGDADKIALFLTQQAGVLRGVAKGARKLRSKFGAGLEPFTVINLTYRAKEDRELVSIQNIEIRDSYFNNSSDPDVMADWAFMGELIASLSPPNEPNPKLFALSKACMETLAGEPFNRRAVRLYFSLWLLKICGMLPGWNTCLRCHESLAPEGGIFVDGKAHLYCINCRPPTARTLAPNTFKLLVATRTHGPAEFAKLVQSDTQATLDLEAIAGTLLAAAL